MQRRFIVLSTKWMYNSDAQFEKSGQRQLKFKKTKWKSALEAIKKITLSTKNNRVIITLDFDLEVQNKILVEHNEPKIKNNNRNLTF